MNAAERWKEMGKADRILTGKWEIKGSRGGGDGKKTVKLLVVGDVSRSFTMQMKLPSMLQSLLYSFFNLLHS